MKQTTFTERGGGVIRPYVLSALSRQALFGMTATIERSIHNLGWSGCDVRSVALSGDKQSRHGTWRWA